MDTDQALLDALYLGVTDAQAFERAIVMLASKFGCGSSALVALDRQRPETNLILSTGVFDAAASKRYAEYYGAIDPAPAAIARLPVGTVSATDRMMSREDFHSEFVQDFYRPLGMRETLVANIASNGGQYALLGLHRGQDRPAFTDFEIATLERFIPHLTRAIQLRRSFINVEAHSTSLQTMLDRSLSGMALMESPESAIFINATLREISARGDGLSLDRRGRLIPAHADARRVFDRTVADIFAGGSGAIVMPRSADERPYSVLVAPAPGLLAQWNWERRARPGAIVLVHDPARRMPNAVETLRQGMGLTAGAARLVAALSADDDLKSFAEREGVTIHTARFHLRTALVRTGTRTQAELVRYAVQMLRDLSLQNLDA